MDFKRLTDTEWTRLLSDIKAGRLSGPQLAHNIAVLAKPADHGRIDRAKYIVAQYVDDPDDWVRHEVLWFFMWGQLREFRSAIADRCARRRSGADRTEVRIRRARTGRHRLRLGRQSLERVMIAR